ncbi:hypothetical protein ABMA79_14375 [Halobacteriovorax sp. HFRX-2_2]|uniref:hypothetical protein n=1 Tax=unclassified Halobacteriovorax TaxID=2639665 RepID=UPI00371992D4
MKKLALVFLFLLSVSNVFALNESGTNCDDMYASSDNVASVEAEVPAVAPAGSSSSTQSMGQ